MRIYLTSQPSESEFPFPGVKFITALKDLCLGIGLCIATFGLTIQPIMQLTDKENKIRISATHLYNRAVTEGYLTEEKKRTYLGIWKQMMQPKNNKFKVLKIYFVTSISLPLLALITCTILEYSLMIPESLFKLFSAQDDNSTTGPFEGTLMLRGIYYILELITSDNFLRMLRFFQQACVVRIGLQFLRMFHAYPTFFLNNKRIKFMKTVCYLTGLNLFTNIYGVSKQDNSFAWLLVFILVPFTVLFANYDVKHKLLVSRLNYSLCRFIR